MHTYPYRETSLIVETFTCSHGRVVLVAKGAKRPHGAMRGLLNPFQPLTLNWFGKSEMKTLKTVEQERIIPQLSGAALLSAFYMNELLLKLTHREDPHDVLFDAYGAAVNALATLSADRNGVRDIATILRQFEVRLLQELGYALQLSQEAESHRPLDPEGEYLYQAERGPVRCEMARQSYNEDCLQLSGKTLIDMANNDYADPQTQVQAKQLMRRMINHLLGDKVLHTRNLMRDLR
ncbi:MAG: DNA repair protein RecO [Betaproteobacteria bacterium]